MMQSTRDFFGPSFCVTSIILFAAALALWLSSKYGSSSDSKVAVRDCVIANGTDGRTFTDYVAPSFFRQCIAASLSPLSK